MLSYVAKDYVGFKRVSFKDSRHPMKSTPTVEVEDDDAGGICTHLAPDAFVVWEDLVRTRPLRLLRLQLVANLKIDLDHCWLQSLPWNHRHSVQGPSFQARI